jgi:methylmalonyl-CoA/ethylmalonyl-CoA epimerase
MTLHHVGIVVENLAAYGEMYSRCLGLTPDSAIIHDTIQKVRIQFWKDAQGNLLELIEAAAPDSPVLGALKKGGGLNHLCYEVDDIDEQVQISTGRGGIVVSGIVPALALSGRRVVFIFFPKLDLVEFVEAVSK